MINTGRDRLFHAIPNNAKAVYIHVSPQFGGWDGSGWHSLLDEMKKRYGGNNVGISFAPVTSGQSFTHYHPHIEAKKLQRILPPFENLKAQRGVDAILYLCDYLCDGYQSPVFPEDCETRYHIWHAIRLAEGYQKPLIVGFQKDWCFRHRCPEREYITNPEKIKCPTSAIQI